MTSSPSLDFIRNDILINFGALALYAGIADGYVALGADEDLVKVIADAADRARQIVRLKNVLLQAKRDADLTAEAAMEWRAARKSAPSVRSKTAAASSSLEGVA